MKHGLRALTSDMAARQRYQSRSLKKALVVECYPTSPEILMNFQCIQLETNNVSMISCQHIRV